MALFGRPLALSKKCSLIETLFSSQSSKKTPSRHQLSLVVSGQIRDSAIMWSSRFCGVLLDSSKTPSGRESKLLPHRSIQGICGFGFSEALPLPKKLLQQFVTFLPLPRALQYTWMVDPFLELYPNNPKYSSMGIVILLGDFNAWNKTMQTPINNLFLFRIALVQRSSTVVIQEAFKGVQQTQSAYYNLWATSS